MKRNIPPDESAQCAYIYIDAQALFQNALKQGYDPHAIADVFLEAARDTPADNDEFMTVFERFRKRRSLP